VVAQRVSLVRAAEEDWKKVLKFELGSKSKTFAAFENEKDVRKYLRKSNVFFIQVGGKLIGTVSFESEKDKTAYMDGLTISTKYRGKGFGTEAMVLIMEEVKGFKKATKRVHPKNTPALLMYLKYGFEIVRWEDNHYGDGQPRLFLEKILK